MPRTCGSQTSLRSLRTWSSGGVEEHAPVPSAGDIDSDQDRLMKMIAAPAKMTPGCCRATDQRGTDHHNQHARDKEPGPPASPQGPRHARPPAACRLFGPGQRAGPALLALGVLARHCLAVATVRSLALRGLGSSSPSMATRPCVGAMQNSCRWRGDLPGRSRSPACKGGGRGRQTCGCTGQEHDRLHRE